MYRYEVKIRDAKTKSIILGLYLNYRSPENIEWYLMELVRKLNTQLNNNMIYFTYKRIKAV